MKTKNSLRDFARSLFEGAEGFEKEVGHVDPAGDSEGGSAEHAHHVSGNPKGAKAEAEKAKFATKEKSEWPGKPAPTSLLEQLEEEITEMMEELHGEEEEMQMEGDDDAQMEEAVLEMDEEEVMKVAIDYTAALYQAAGVGRFVRSLAAALAELQKLCAVYKVLGAYPVTD